MFGSEDAALCLQGFAIHLFGVGVAAFVEQSETQTRLREQIVGMFRSEDTIFDLDGFPV